MTRRREFLKFGALGAAALYLPSAALAAAEDPYLRFVHPELRARAAAMLAMMRNAPALSASTLAAQRIGMARWARPKRDDIAVERRIVPGGKGQPDVTVHIVNAKPGEARGAILHTHGGGYVLGNSEIGLRDLQDLCGELNCVAVSADYRLAPETTYVGSIEDNYAALKWLHANAASIGGDPARIAVMGESAGGGHAALLAITARDRGEVPIAFQCLIYPMLDDRTGSSRRVPEHIGRIIWNEASNRYGWEAFLGTKPGGSRVHARGVPARTANLAGLPPTFIGVGGIDLFVDEDADYAQRLNAAGVLTELNVVPGAFHGFDAAAAALPVGKIFTAAKLNALRRGFGMPPVS